MTKSGTVLYIPNLCSISAAALFIAGGILFLSTCGPSLIIYANVSLPRSDGQLGPTVTATIWLAQADPKTAVGVPPTAENLLKQLFLPSHQPIIDSDSTKSWARATVPVEDWPRVQQSLESESSGNSPTILAWYFETTPYDEVTPLIRREAIRDDDTVTLMLRLHEHLTPVIGCCFGWSIFMKKFYEDFPVTPEDAAVSWRVRHLRSINQVHIQLPVGQAHHLLRFFHRNIGSNRAGSELSIDEATPNRIPQPHGMS
eukprot:GHVT01011228.1.p3 GENE.GHVT01011228.1~~GHVT01011228.1.p3  ORF type:complete len:257 (+),score=11.06 GHVT01011228.1:5969-6739(+)